jgi:proline dehydrogenase
MFMLRRARLYPQSLNIPLYHQKFSSSSSKSQLNFDDAKSAFKSRTTFEIARALFIFKLCSFKWVVQNAGKILDVSNKFFGQKITNSVIEKTFFAHFCAGEDAESIKPVIKRLESQGIHSILDFAAEKDKKADEIVQSGIQSRAYDEQIEEQECEDNVEIFLECIRAASQFENGFAAIKVTGLGRPILLEALASVVYAVRKAFIDLDEDGTNALNFEKFYSGIRKLGVEFSETEAKELFDRFDTDKNGIIDIIEWTEYLKVEDL